MEHAMIRAIQAIHTELHLAFKNEIEQQKINKLQRCLKENSSSGRCFFKFELMFKSIALMA